MHLRESSLIHVYLQRISVSVNGWKWPNGIRSKCLGDEDKKNEGENCLLLNQGKEEIIARQ